ncbi:MAG TPA: TonB-dependent receptor [Lacunisphaera sp.]|nr:TonB-dependent receptor [Lacunisphaera sp.]
MKLSRLALSSVLVAESLCYPGLLKAADEVLQLNPFEITSATKNDSYRATETVSASGIALPLRELPIPVDVVTRQLLDDRGVSDLLGASQLFPGVSTGGPVLNGQETWRIHGYAAPGLRNGFRLDNDTTNASEMERVEVARGPTAVLYGSGATGGVINRVTKKPQFTPGGEFTFGFGTYDFYQAMVDATGPLDFQGKGHPTLAYRVILSREHNISDQDWYASTRTSYNGSLRWRPNDRLMLTAEYSRNTKNNAPWIEVVEGTNANGATVFDKDPTHRGYQFSIQGPDTYLNMTGDVLELQGNLNFTRDVTLNVGYVHHTSEMNDLRARRIDLWAQGKPAQLEQAHETVDQDLWKANLLWNWSGQAVNNKFLAGYEYSNDVNPNLTQRISNWVPPADFSITAAVLAQIHASNPATNRNRTTILEAYRATDFLTLLNGRLHVLGGARRDLDVKQKDTVTNTNVTLAGGTTYQAGAMFDVTKALGVFANYSTDFVANTQFGPGNVALDPSRGKSFTVGVKFGLLDDKLTGELSYFDEKRTNIPNRIGQTSFFELTGEDQSKGWDFNLAYDATKNLQVMVGGSFFDAKTISNPADVTQVGLPPQDVCPSSLFWQATYKFTENLKGFSVGLGGFWHDDYPTESSAKKRLERTDDVAIWDAFARYGFKFAGHDAHVSLTVTNLTDKRGYVLVQETFGPPRMIRGTFTYEF